jgi:DNA-binding NarL/FixJ family response regulator
MAIKVAIGCYNHLLGEALKKLIGEEREINIIGVFNDEIAFNEIVKMNPDVVLVDLRIFHALPEGFAADTKTKLLIIGDKSLNAVSERWVADLVSNGVVGILPPGGDSLLLKKAIKAIYSGEFWLDRKTMSNIVSQESLVIREREKLTGTEREIAFLICRGRKNREVAQILNISEQTVKSHLSRIFKKVKVSDRLQLAIKLGGDRYHHRHLN